MYTTGSATSAPANFDPLSTSSYTGTMGLLYEPLFLYDPASSRLVPWLARAGYWAGPRTYEIDVRAGAYWVDSTTGQQVGRVSPADVAFSLRLARTSSSGPYHDDVVQVSSVSTNGQAVVVHFGAQVNHPLWDDYLWHAPVLPASFWPPSGSGSTAHVVASGPMLLYKVGNEGACYRQDPWWWGWSQLHLRFAFRFLCDEVSHPAGQQLSALLNGRLDWSNSLLGGAANLGGYPGGGYGVEMYYPSQPFMSPAATEWLTFGLRRSPMSSATFRRGIAYALDPAKVAQDDYAGTVTPAAPVGLLPSEKNFVDKEVVARDGFSFSVAKAKKLLRSSGYKGQPVRLEVASGGPELENAAGTLAAQMRAAGLKVSVDTVSPARLRDDVAAGSYDMALQCSPGPAPTPWQYFRAAFGGGAGLGPAVQQQVRSLLATAASTPAGDLGQLTARYSPVEKLFLTQLPVVPLWYSGAWFEASTAHWQGYPSASVGSDHYTPVMWRGWLGATTTVLALARLRPREKSR